MRLIVVALETKKHKYKVRPGYKSDKLLIQFCPYSFEERFLADLRSVLVENNLTLKSKEDLVFLYIYHYDSPCGPFELDHDEWNFVFIHAEENQDAIHYMDRILSESGKFEKEEVNNEDYA